jgi:UDP-2-acetamido-2,6-beta-L-arabino-hexul-4-ose reductase
MEKLNVGITGIVGFVGSHLRERLGREESLSVIEPFEDSFFEEPERLKEYLRHCGVVVHLAAMNRGEPGEIYNVNVELVDKLIAAIEELDIRPHIIFSSSTQCDLDNPYGRSKKEGMRLLSKWAKRNGTALTLMVIPNVFGDHGKPFYNSVVATFCHQISHGEQPKVMVDKNMGLIYVNELTELICQAIKNPPEGVNEVRIQPTSQATVTEVLALLERYRDDYYDKKLVPHFKNVFERNLYNTFITYMDEVDYEQSLQLHSDDRGNLVEVVKQVGVGQIFFSTTKSGITRGNHYHTRKMEKFCVVKGKGLIKMRRIGTDKVIEFKVSGDRPVAIEIPIFHTHNITNVGSKEMLTLFWTNELFDPLDPDTFYEEV